MEQLEGDVVRKRKKYPKLCEIPFNSINKYQISIHLMPDDKCLLVMKGAPEKVLDHCGSILRDGEVMSMTPLHLKPVKKIHHHFGE
ncbi:hypothetical protein NQ315_001655 [Exocentrus adspersus]|uniref:Uncharacterized protein n=1 Tax=Exocentrus adspersus TaxID=1586481 RepID=A0AAV8W8U4_9CUCU|nr:hypothetical protein NQ315_001655 [Exocentrus adspersus]